MDSQQNPDGDIIENELNETFIQHEDVDDEASPSDSEKSIESDNEDSPDPGELILDCSDESSDEHNDRQIDFTQMSLASRSGNSLQKLFRRSNENEARPPTQHQERILTPSEVRMQEVLSQAVGIPQEAEHTMFERYEMPEDETLPEVRQLTQRGFISARTVHSLVQKANQSQRATPPVIRHVETKEKAVLLPEAANESEDDLNDDELEQIVQEEEKHDLNHSLGNLSQVLSTSRKAGDMIQDTMLNHSLVNLSQVVSSSQKVAELIEDTVARTRNVDLDATCLDIENVSSDEENDFAINTEALENNFLRAPIKLSEPLTGDTEAFENNFMCLESHAIDSTQTAPFWNDLRVSSAVGGADIGETQDLEEKFLDLETQADVFTQQPPEARNLQIGSGIGSKYIGETEALEGDFLHLPENFTQQPPETRNFQMSSGIGNTGMFSGFSFTTGGFDLDPPTNQPAPAFAGFGFASGKAVATKEFSRFEKAFLEADKQIEAEVAENREFLKTPVPVRQFKVPLNSPSMPSTSLNNSSFVSTPESSKPHSRFSRKQPLKDDSFATFQPLVSPAAPMPMMGFATASGASFKLKENTLGKISAKFAQEDERLRQDLVENPPDDETPVKPQSRFSRKQPLNDDSFVSFQPLVSPAAQMPMTGFATASGASFKLKENTLSKISAKFAQEDERLCQDLAENPPDDVTPVKPRLKKLKLDFGDTPAAQSPRMMGFQRGISKQSTPFVSRMPKPETQDVNFLNENFFDSPPTQKQKKLPEARPLNKIIQSGAAAPSPQMMGFQRGISKHSTPFLSRMPRPETQDLNFLNENFFDSPPPPPKRKKFSKVRLLNKLNESDEEDGEGILSELLVPNQVKTLRRQAREAQQKSIKEKADCDKAQMAGSVFMLKSSRNRLKVREFVGNELPQVLSRHNVTYSNALDFRFDMKEFLSEEFCRKNVGGVSLGDNARLFLDDKARVGIEEIKSAFSSSPGVDPALAEDLWVENAFKLLVLKLAWLENSFSKFERFEVLSPENLLLQMKYRYDREIDRHHRPAIRKIVELDEVPCRRMVLKVLDVIESLAVGYELVVSDGWHSIKATIDAGLADAVTRQKISVGTKLITSNAELVGCQHGADPLQMPDSVRLKIHANSTRLAGWDDKLGCCANPNPIRVSLDSVLATGGMIGRLLVVVTHVYQVIYVDSSKEPKEFRSEKLQLRLQNKLDILNFSLYETIANQVQREKLKQLEDRVAALKQAKPKLENLDYEEICDLLDFETDAESSAELQAKLSRRQMRRAQEIREKRQNEMNQEIRARIGEQDKNLSKLLKFRVVDALNPRKTALVSCWVVHDELLDMLKEGKAIEIMKATAGPCNKELQVTVGKSSVVRPSRVEFPEEKFRKFFRNETRISDIGPNFQPPQNEFDLACVIVHIESRDDKRSVKVFVADEATNVLCLNFWSSLGEGAFDDVVIEGHIVYAKNLQWRRSSTNEKIPQAFVVNDTTSFLLHPKQEAQERRLNEIGVRVGQMDEFLAKCREKIGKEETINKENNKSMNSTLNQSIESRSNASRSFEAKVMPSPASTTRKRLGMSRSSLNKELFSSVVPKKKTAELTSLQRLAFQRR